MAKIYTPFAVFDAGAGIVEEWDVGKERISRNRGWVEPSDEGESSSGSDEKMSDVQTYANYELVEESWDPEWREYRYIFQGTLVRRWQRMVHSKTYEATLHESQPFPGAVNPENLDTRDWKLQSCTCTKQLSVPLSKRASETWAHEGNWVLVDEWSESGS